ncbi:cell wall hydrolase [Lachnoclostridium sp.]|uniref:cell wall hydrolase n=1 Tax=Lachnoclostridium sp. TaxID=2028282 RepID=UPI002898C45C|nr:cell wall hydrolase [Lachnoclostridium sp.]
MLKIYSFLRTMKDKEKHFEKGIQYKHSKRIAIVAYVLAAILLVTSFVDIPGLHLYSLEYMVNAATHDATGQEDGTQDLSYQKDAKLLETSLLVNPLGQMYQGELAKEDIESFTDNNTEAKVAIADPMEQLNRKLTDIANPDDGDIVLLSLADSEKELININATSQYGAELALANVSVENTAIIENNEKAVASKDGKKAEANKDSQKADSSKDKEKAKDNAKDSASKKDKATTTSAKSDALVKTLNKKMIKSLSKDELDVLYRIVEAEATGEDIYGKILVANVILNRVNSKQFPNTVEEVVFQKDGNTYQFSPTKDGRYWSVKVSKETMEAVNRALAGEDYSNGALYFFARKQTSKTKACWFDNSLRKVVKYGCHEFYKDK